MGSPSLFFVYHTANCAAAQGGGSVLSDASRKRTMPGSPKAARHRIDFLVQRTDGVHRALILLCHLCKLLLCALQLPGAQGLGQGIGGRVQI